MPSMHLSTRAHRMLHGDVFGSAENSQALNHLLQPDGMCMLVGISTAVIIGIWEFCSFFPAEIVLWVSPGMEGTIDCRNREV